MSVRTLLAKLPLHKLRFNVAGANITTLAWRDILASTPKGCTAITVAYDGEGILQLSDGDTGLEDQSILNLYIVPGMNMECLIPLEVAGGKKLAAKALDQDATMGDLIINFYG